MPSPSEPTRPGRSASIPPAILALALLVGASAAAAVLRPNPGARPVAERVVLARDGAARKPPVVPGFARWTDAGDRPALVDPDDPDAEPIPVDDDEPLPEIDPVSRGRLLLGELNCVACHADPDRALVSNPRVAPILTDVGSRTRHEYFSAYLADPRGHHPGTPMPDVLRGLPEAERAAAVDELAHFLASTGTPSAAGTNLEAVVRGNALYHAIGCVACHGPRDVTPAIAEHPALMPLGDLSKKYSLDGLTAFLREPRAVRPSGRMPRFDLQDRDYRDLAQMFLAGTRVPPNVRYAIYEGEFRTFPDFARLEPVERGETLGLEPTRGGDNFGIRYEAFLRIDRAAEYTFHLFADDKLRLTIDGVEVAAADYPNPATGRIRLEPGYHPVVVDYAEFAGQEALTLEFEAPGFRRRPVSGHLSLDKSPPKRDGSFAMEVDPAKAEKGRDRFASLGCASCHELKVDGLPIASELRAGPLAAIARAPDRGCLAESPANASAPRYDLSPAQRESIVAALASLAAKPAAAAPAEPALEVRHALAAFNCYACHERDGRGGPLSVVNALFQTTTPEMGEEGRIPPTLTGVGDKVRESWLRHALANGQNIRPYMKTAMPAFGPGVLGDLPANLAALDARNDAPDPEPFLDPLRAKALGRRLVGDRGVGCVSCHTFGNLRSSGVQALSLTTMHDRLRPDWLNRYLPDPQAYRPGTRMPSAWPDGKSILPDVLDGDPSKQILVIREYLSDGANAQPPSGVGRTPIELKPTDRPIIYRNFLRGLSPRAIAVGYPEGVHLAFDAETCDLAMIWRGAFIDASMHWVDRGNGFQVPLGDLVLNLVRGVPLGVPADPASTPWPADEPKPRFLGYKLDPGGRPTFRYAWEGLVFEDAPEPRGAGEEARFVRSIAFRPGDDAAVRPAGALHFRAAAGSSIEPVGPNAYRIDGILTLEIDNAKAGGRPVVLRESAGREELLVPIDFDADAPAGTLVLTYFW